MTFALGAAVGPVPASHTADAPVLIPAPIAAWATQTCAWAGGVDIYHVHTALGLLARSF